MKLTKNDKLTLIGALKLYIEEFEKVEIIEEIREIFNQEIVNAKIIYNNLIYNL